MLRSEASDEQRADHRIIEDGQGIWWDKLDDGLSVPGLFGLSHTSGPVRSPSLAALRRCAAIGDGDGGHDPGRHVA
jgi:hypothetical protein